MFSPTPLFYTHTHLGLYYKYRNHYPHLNNNNIQTKQYNCLCENVVASLVFRHSLHETAQYIGNTQTRVTSFFQLERTKHRIKLYPTSNTSTFTIIISLQSTITLTCKCLHRKQWRPSSTCSVKNKQINFSCLLTQQVKKTQVHNTLHQC